MLGFEEICGRRRDKGDPAPHFGLVREMSATRGGADDWVEYKNVVVEPSEEVRLLLTKLLCFLIKAANKIIYSFASDVASTLMAVANDSCPNVLVETFVALEVLGDVMGDKLKPISKQLVSVVLPSLSHNQSKVRLAAIHAIHRLILCGAHESIYQLTAFQDPNLVPIRAFYHPDIKTQYLALLASDKNVSVRRELLQTVVSWLQNLSERKEHEVRLLPYVISAMNDPNPQLQDLAFVSMEELGEQYEIENASEVADVKYYLPEDISDYSHMSAGEPLPPPFKSRPRLGARIMVRSCIGLLLHAISADLQAWTNGTKDLAANFLYTILIFTEDYATMHLQPLLIMLIKGSKDSLIADTMFRCAKLLGHFVKPSAYLPILLPRITGEISGDITSEQAGRVVKLLASFMHGSSPELLTAHIPDICSTITEQELLTSFHQEVAEGIVMLSKRMVVSLRGECEETLSVLWILTNAIAVAELCKRSTAEAENVLEGLAKTSGYSSAASLAAAYMSQLISLLRHPSLWTGWSLEVLIVARFLKMANLADEFAVDKLLGFVEYFTNTSINTEINLRLLLAMQTMLISTPSGYFMTEHAQAILENFIKTCIDAEGQLHQPACEMRDILLKIYSKCIPLSLAPLRKEFSGLELADLEGTFQEKPEKDPMLG